MSQWNTHSFYADEEFAREKDQQDLAGRRDAFFFPPKTQEVGVQDANHPSTAPQEQAVYFCGNSLGLQPKGVQAAIQQELMDWQNLAVRGYFEAKNPWLFYHKSFEGPLSQWMGALPEEITVMNTLTINLHLMMQSFYRHTGKRNKIIMEAGAFPSDQYAVETVLKSHGFHPDATLIEISPLPGSKLITTEQVVQAIEEQGEELALVLMGGIQYYTGQLFDIEKITKATKAVGAVSGWDLAHAAGNVPLKLHDWGVDFAVWCSYKYLNGGPGGVGGVFVHQKHHGQTDLPRLAGWWGNSEETRFKMEKGFVPKHGADGWQVSTAQVFNMVSLKASLDVFATTSPEQLREKSIALTGYLEFLIHKLPISCEVITPQNPAERGAQLSLYFEKNGKDIQQTMMKNGVICDYREPGVIRLAPAPLYNSFSDVYRFYKIILETYG